ncbi:flavin-containing monooxygenase [Novosphingobium aquimarinum]|uniref:flavin-containing monooxygenase n=1 Tax=Novosphingobium aquimarinum TaxID=2682494 RepID=UPI0012EBDAF0|nr:NAD(P)/FAD-dependent oxidoreductase [Novosphingobium aquimarinum]
MATLPSHDAASETLRKYQEERDKRLDPRIDRSYAETKGKYRSFVDVDPNAGERIERAAIATEVDVAIVGGGFGGILAAARLKEAGVTDVMIVEKASDFGGTWYWNRYPGVQCDIESYSYLPLLEETGYMPKEKFSFGDEILRYCQQLGTHFDLYDKAVFQTEVTGAEWDAAASRWIVSTDRGDRIAARYFLLGSGRANEPKLPAIPGIESFRGKSFHSSRWDYSITGGSIHDPLDKLHDKRVAVIGTGATGIQLIPRVARSARQLYVFQRTPSSVGERFNAPTDPGWYKTLGRGWQKQRRELWLQAVHGSVDDSEVRDGWTDFGRLMRETAPTTPETEAEIGARAMLIDVQVMNNRRARIDATIENKETAERLKPWYNLYCKRPTFNDEFLPVFNQANTKLVDISETPITRITEDAIIVDDQRYEVDLIIFASGFHVVGPVEQRIRFPIAGRDGKLLSEHWRDGMRTLHGLMAHGFPNWFYLGQGQNAVTANYTTTVDDQAIHLAYIIAAARQRGASIVEPTAEAEEAWQEVIRSSMLRPAEFYASCTPGYYNNEGMGGTALFEEGYGAGPAAFDALLSDWRRDGNLAGLDTH